MAAATAVEFDRSEVVSLLQELGFATADKWPNSKLKTRVEGLDKVIDEETKPTTKEGEKLLEQIQEAVNDGTEFEITGGDEEAPGVKGKKGAKPDGKKPGKKGAKPDGKKPGKTKPEKEEVEKDRFGSRVGTDTAAWNEQITSTPKKMSEIVKDAGLERTFYNHANAMIEAGHIVKSDEGYKLAPKKK